MKIAIYSQHAEKHSNSILLELFSFNKKYKIDFFLEKQFEKELVKDSKLKFNYNIFSKHKDLDNSFDLMITIGGDGTLLRSISFVRDLEIPIIGINTGRLGFLATLNQDLLKPKLEKIIKGEYKIEERTLLEVKIDEEKDDFLIALNEISVGRKNTTSMIKIKTNLDGEFLNSYWADGLIVSTPTGSTGYSLSCGGPIMSPQSQTLALTPIAPHNLNARPIIIADNTEIELSVSGREDFHLLSLDSRIISLKNEKSIIIKKANFKIMIAHLFEDNFYKTLRNKLLWGEDKRNI
ncbi:NAD kinase [Flavobacteriaceae bacterium]|jgi:NAD+ kinase|nr:NAD kinase [Flavobacteriaceae bacterium]|tara:strand:- start:5441 stop:6319 length:879 start_codon:yes stop_codon:yes gene_type:complete